MDGAESAGAQEVRSARARWWDYFENCRRQPAGQIMGEKDFWLLFVFWKVIRSAMEWHRNPPWMASQSDKQEEQVRRTNQSNKKDKSEEQARRTNQTNNQKNLKPTQPPDQPTD